ncbi:helix-turn-helix domain-containing protein [Bradyrhizobium sp. CAR08]
MSTALVLVRERSFAQELTNHYRAVRARLGAPETVPALPPARRELILAEAWVPLDVIDRLAPSPLLTRAPRLSGVTAPLLPAPEPHIVRDVVPRRHGCVEFSGRALNDDALQYARRRTVAAYLAAVKADPGGPRLTMIRHAAAVAFKIDSGALISAGRQKALQQGRQFAMCMARTLTGASLGQIGRAFGGRDHTTAHHAFKKLRPALLDLLGEMYDGGSCEVWLSDV